jgi:hypothetical protein
MNGRSREGLSCEQTPAHNLGRNSRCEGGDDVNHLFFLEGGRARILKGRCETKEANR